MPISRLLHRAPSPSTALFRRVWFDGLPLSCPTFLRIPWRVAIVAGKRLMSGALPWYHADSALRYCGRSCFQVLLLYVGGRKQNNRSCRVGTYYICVILVVKDFRFQGSSVGAEYNIGYFCPGTGTASPSCRSCYPATPGPARLYSSSTNLRRIEIVTLYHTYLIGT